MPSKRLEPRRANGSWVRPRPETATWKRSGRWWWPSARRSPPRSRRLNQIRHLGFTAPEEIRQSLQGLTRRMVAKQAAAMRPRAGSDPVIYATKTALRALGRRVLALDAETAGDRPAAHPAAPSRPRGPAVAVWGRYRQRRRPAGRRRRQPRPAALRAVVGPAVRRRPDRSIIGQGRPATDSTPAVTAKPTPLCGTSWSPA